MADQLYIEEGYIDASYYNIVAEAQVNMGSALTASISVIIADTSGYIFEGYIDDDFYEGAGQVREAYAALGGATTMAISVGKIVEADANFEAFGNTTLTADALKNHTAILDTTMSMSATVSKIASNVITLNSIINASLQGDRTRGVESAQNVTIYTQTAPSVFRDFGALLSSAGGFNLLMTVNADVAISVNSTMVANAISFAPKTLPFSRPNNLEEYVKLSSGSAWTANTGSSFISYVTPANFSYLSEYNYIAELDSTNPSGADDASALYAALPTTTIDEDDDFYIEIFFDPRIGFGDGFNGETTFLSLGDSLNTPYIQSSNFQSVNMDGVINIGMYSAGNAVGTDEYLRAKILKSNGTYLTMTIPTLDYSRGRFVLRRIGSTIDFYYNSAYSTSATYSGRIGPVGSIDTLGIYDSNPWVAQDPQFGRLIVKLGDGGPSDLDNDINTIAESDENTVIYADFQQTLNDNTALTLAATATLSSAFSLTATPNRTFGGTVLQQSAATLTVNASAITTTGANLLHSDTSLTVVPGFVKDATTNFDSIASQINVVNKIGNTLIACDVVSSLSADVNEIVQLASSLSTAVVVDADVNFIAGTSADFNSVSVIDADVAGGLIGFEVDLNSEFTSSIVYTRIIDLEVFEPLANFEYNFDVNATLDNTANLSTAFTSTATASRIQQGSADLSAFATTLNSVAKIGTFLVDLDTTATLTANARVIANNSFVLDVIADITASGSTTKLSSANLTSASTLSVEAVSGIAGEASLTGVTELQISPSSVISASAILDNAMSFNTTVRATRNNEIDLHNNASLVASASRTRNVANNLNTTTNLVASGGKLVGTSANLDSSTSLIGNGRIITLLQELEYTIQKETREFAILKETREYAILDETREYTV